MILPDITFKLFEAVRGPEGFYKSSIKIRVADDFVMKGYMRAMRVSLIRAEFNWHFVATLIRARLRRLLPLERHRLKKKSRGKQ
jgi:hypothetical protein